METLIAIITNAHLIDRYWVPNRSSVGIFDVEFVHLCSVICLYRFRTIHYGFQEMFHFVYIGNCVNLKLLWNFIHAIVSHWYLFSSVSVSECVHPFELVMWTMYVWPFRTNLRSWTLNFQAMKFIEHKHSLIFFLSSVELNRWNGIRLSLTLGSILSRSKFRCVFFSSFHFHSTVINERIDLLRHIFQWNWI